MPILPSSYFEWFFEHRKNIGFFFLLSMFTLTLSASIIIHHTFFECLKEDYFDFGVISLIISIITSKVIQMAVIRERELTLKIVVNHEALSSNKTTVMITENVHHEVNTPIEVISNKLAKIRELVIPLLMDEELYEIRFIEQIIKDFDMIEDSVEIIHNVVNKMKDYKHLKYSNGNKSLYDLVNGAFSVLHYTNGNFEYEVDKKLKLYKISNSNFKNASLVNIILNHLKNSLTANANQIKVIIDDFSNGFCTFRIIDNGNGIDNNIKKHIFEPNFSTKSIPGEISGNGLSINRMLLRDFSGDVTLIDSDINGTTFLLKVPAIKR